MATKNRVTGLGLPTQALAEELYGYPDLALREQFGEWQLVFRDGLQAIRPVKPPVAKALMSRDLIVEVTERQGFKVYAIDRDAFSALMAAQPKKFSRSKEYR